MSEPIKKDRSASDVPIKPIGEDGNSDKCWAAIISSIRSPLSMFALVVLITNTGFAAAAASFRSLEAFVYSMHLFLGIVGTFTIIALWDPHTLYHPKDILGIGDKFSRVQIGIKLLITALILSLLIVYGVREYYKYQQKNAAITQIVETIKTDLIKDNSAFTIACTKQDKTNEKKLAEITCRFIYTENDRQEKPIEESP